MRELAPTSKYPPDSEGEEHPKHPDEHRNASCDEQTGVEFTTLGDRDVFARSTGGFAILGIR
jgi:hypothetical protein